jgi:DNA polymerase (family X)
MLRQENFFTKQGTSVNLLNCYYYKTELQEGTHTKLMSRSTLPYTRNKNFYPSIFNSHELFPIADQWCNTLGSFPNCDHIEISGDLRRGKHSLNQIDIVIGTQSPIKLIDQILNLNTYRELIEESSTRLILKIEKEIPLFVWVTTPEYFASTLFITTGPPKHIQDLNRIAALSNKRITYNGIFNGVSLSKIKEESEIYSHFNLAFIPPEARDWIENFENAKPTDFNSMINLSDLRSDLHIHTNWSDGKNTLDEIISSAIAHNFSTIAITDHSPYVLSPRYKDGSYFNDQHFLINLLCEKYQSKITILKGVEADILPNGELDLSTEMLQKMDIVIASMHVNLDRPQENNTERLIRAIENPFVDIIGHPGGRIDPMQDHTSLDWDRIFQAAAFNQVALEINSHKVHPFFDSDKVRRAALTGVPIALNSDTHRVKMMDNARFGINIARRAGLNKNMVINTWTNNHLLFWLKRKRNFIASEQRIAGFQKR